LPRGTPTRARCTRAHGAARHPEPRRRQQAVRRDRAALRGAAGRLHPHPAHRLPRGDSAEVAQIELVGSEYDPNAEARKTEAKAEQKPKGVGGRPARGGGAPARQGQARRGRAEGAEAAPKKKAKPERTYDGKGGKTDTRGKGAKTSSPRKAGGS
jgi:hypothetical protein